MFKKKDTYILGLFMGAFFTYIGTSVFIPTYLGHAISLNQTITLPPPISFVFFIVEMVMVYLGITVGVWWTGKIKKRRPVMVTGGLGAGLLSLLTHVPFVLESTIISNVIKIIAIFFVCICLSAWTFVIGEVSSQKESGMQIGTILTIAALIGSLAPIIQGFLFSIDLFEIGWFFSSLMLFIMGICGYFSPETGLKYKDITADG